MEALEDRRLLSAARLDYPRVPVGEVHSHEISADGQFAVYLADDVTEGLHELYSVEFSSGDVSKLSEGAGRVLGGYQISPDSTRVVYRAAAGGVTEIYSVPLRGGDVTKLNGPMAIGGNVETINDYRTHTRFLISPNSDRVVYVADQEKDQVFELFSVPITGGTEVKLSGPMVDGGDVAWEYQFSPDGSHVVYVADQSEDGVLELYSAQSTGGSPTKLNDSLVSGGDVWSKFQISPDGGHIFYLADQDTPGMRELYRVSIDGGDVTKLNIPLIDNGSVFSFQISPDSSRVVYSAESERKHVRDIYSIPWDGGSSVKLSIPLADNNTSVSFEFTPDGSRVAYFAKAAMSTVNEWYSTPVSGGGSIKLSGPLVDGGEVVNRFNRSIGLGGTRLVYIADQDVDGVFDLYSVPLTGGEPVAITGGLPRNADVTSFRITADGARVVYQADQETNDAFDLYSVPVAGGEVIRLNDTLVNGGDVAGDGFTVGFQFSQDGNRVVYRADQDTDSISELYSAPLTGGGSTKHSQPIRAVAGGVRKFDVTADGRHTVFLGVQETANVAELYSVATATGIVTKLSHSLLALDSINDFRTSADGSWVVYQDNQSALYSVPAGGGSVTKLNDFLANHTEILGFEISPNNEQVVYRSDYDQDGVFELYAATLADGESTRLSDPVISGDGVEADFQISRDGSRVVYRTAQDADSVIELYSAPISGGEPVKLNPLFEPGRNVSSGVQISSDGRWVVYRANQEADAVFELFSVPIEGGRATKLNAPIVSGGGVAGAEDSFGFQISRDSRRVVYRADQDTRGKFELYSVSVGGGTPIKLNGSLVLDGDVIDAQISTDSRHVVYRADQTTNETVELYSVAIDGGDATKLIDSFSSDSDVLQDFVISDDNNWVVFRADQDEDESFELFSVPLAGGASVKLNDALNMDNAALPAFQVSTDSRWVVYLAEQEHGDSLELFVTRLTGGGSTRLNDPLVRDGNVEADFQFGFDGDSVLYRANQDDPRRPWQNGLYAASFSEIVGLSIESVAAGNSAIVVEFSNKLDSSVLNLYDTENGGLGPADIVLEGATTGPVSGSAVLDASHQKVTFVKTGGAFSPDSYTLRFRTGPDGLRSQSGALLNATLDGTQGPDHEAEFVVKAPVAGTATISLPDFVRGPGQQVNLPANSLNGIPLMISGGGTDVRSVDVRIRYNPALLAITSATIPAGMPPGSALTIDTETAGLAVISFFSPTALPEGTNALANLLANVPQGDPPSIYGRQHVLDLHEVIIRDGSGNSLASVADDAIHLIEFFGDVSGDTLVNANDAALVSRVAVSLDVGFAASSLTDPLITGDISGNGLVNAFDASLLAQFAAQLNVHEIPPIPAGIPLAAGGQFQAFPAAPASLIVGPELGGDSGGLFQAELISAASVEHELTRLGNRDLDRIARAVSPLAVDGVLDGPLAELMTEWK